MKLNDIVRNAWLCIKEHRLPTIFSQLTGRAYRQNTRVICLEITMRCNLTCSQCNRSCSPSQAPCGPEEDMTLEQVHDFIRQSREVKRRWSRIIVAGGEPALHPHLLEIVVELCLAFPRTEISVLTNGVGSGNALNRLPTRVRIVNSHKDTLKDSLHVAFCSAPRDRGIISDGRGCAALESCGMALTPHGYWTCAGAASIARVLRRKLGAPTLSDATQKQMKWQRTCLCDYCGHLAVDTSGTQRSKSWIEAYRNYK
jgi:hypothetical protein